MSFLPKSVSGPTRTRLVLFLVLLAVAFTLSGCGISRGPIDPNAPPKGLWEALVVFPLTKSLIFLSDIISNLGIPYSYGFAIVLFTLIIKVVTLPLTLTQLRSMKATQELQPKLQELQKKYGKDRDRLAKAQMELYKEAGVNPLGGCLPLLIQMPILFGLYAALYRLAGLNLLTNQRFFFIPDLSFPTPDQGISWVMRFISEGQYGTVLAYMVLPVLFLISQIILQKMSQTTTPSDSQQAFTNQMMLLMPILFTYFTLTLPSGLSLYWVTSNLLQIVQQYFVTGWGGAKIKPTAAESAPSSKVAKASQESGEGSQPASVPEAASKPSKRSRRRRRRK